MKIGDRNDTEVTTTDFLNRRAEILNEVGYGGATVTVLRRGRKFVRIVPVEEGDNHAHLANRTGTSTV
jgi:prevent-host-death family protein